MTPQQIALVQWTWKQIVPISNTAANLFYARLFELDPSLKLMFRGDQAEQGRKLMSMIAAAVNGLQRVDSLVPVLRNLGARHAGYGVRDEHYATVAEALLWTLERGLGAAFTDDVKEAWTVTYTVLAGAMQDGAARAVAEVKMAFPDALVDAA